MLTHVRPLIDLRVDYVAAPDTQRKIMLVAITCFALSVLLCGYATFRHVSQKPPVIHVAPTKTTAYRCAALSKAENSQEIKQLVGESCQRDPDGSSLLHALCESGNLEAIKALLKCRTVDKFFAETDGYGYTPLHRACLFGHVDIVEELLRHKNIGSVLDIKDRSGRNPLQFAYFVRRLGCFNRLLKHPKTNLLQKDPNNQNILYSACLNNRKDYIESILQHSDANALMLLYDTNNNTPLHAACEVGSLDSVKLLIKYLKPQRIKGALLHKNKDGNTPLHLACLFQRKDIAQELLKQPDIKETFTVQNNDGNTPFHLDQNEIYRLLLECPGSGYALIIKNNKGQTPGSMV